MNFRRIYLLFIYFFLAFCIPNKIQKNVSVCQKIILNKYVLNETIKLMILMWDLFLNSISDYVFFVLKWFFYWKSESLSCFCGNESFFYCFSILFISFIKCRPTASNFTIGINVKSRWYQRRRRCLFWMSY